MENCGKGPFMDGNFLDFPIHKLGICRKVEEIKGLRGGVLYSTSHKKSRRLIRLRRSKGPFMEGN